MTEPVEGFWAEFEAHRLENERAHREILSTITSHLQEERDFQRLLLGNGDEGLFERVRNNTRYIEQQRRLLRIIATSVVLGAGAVVWQAVQGYMQMKSAP